MACSIYHRKQNWLNQEPYFISRQTGKPTSSVWNTRRRLLRPWLTEIRLPENLSCSVNVHFAEKFEEESALKTTLPLPFDSELTTQDDCVTQSNWTLRSVIKNRLRLTDSKELEVTAARQCVDIEHSFHGSCTRDFANFHEVVLDFRACTDNPVTCVNYFLCNSKCLWQIVSSINSTKYLSGFVNHSTFCSQQVTDCTNPQDLVFDRERRFRC